MIPPPLLDPIVDRALAEDLQGGDLTTAATVDPATRAVGRAVAQSALIACGAEVFARVFYRLDSGLRVERLVEDGAAVAAGTVLWCVEGSARSILMAERTALNFAQRMSGVATLAHQYVAAVPDGCITRITDTRKTTPGLRLLERYAVRCGGAFNHRDALGAGLLIKDNHIAAAGGIAPAIERARSRAPHTVRIEIEVESLAALDAALEAGADIVMLDNFAPDEIAEATQRARGRALVEVSGGVVLPRVERAARAGVDLISVGALTHSAPAAEISLELEALGGRESAAERG
jgi:nicotinate-nucleotide pyrophosphorylase (carboxylating)